MDDSGPKISDNEYNPLRSWIKTARSKGISWEDIGKKISDAVFFTNNINNNFWPYDSRDVWPDMVDKMRKEDEARQKTIDDLRRGYIGSRNEINDLDIPSDENSCWQQYKRRLSHKGIDDASILRIEEECHKILNSISVDTVPDEPIKGLVVGNVQSGKTSNMAGLMAMAADHGWNVFIVLSGMVNNLNNQTRNRLQRELDSDPNCNINWMALDDTQLKTKHLNLKLDENSSIRYMIVTIKQVKHLTLILKWLNRDPRLKRQMKVLLT